MMANNVAKTSLFRALTSRNYSSKLNPISGTLSEIKTCTLSNKVVVVAADTGSPITRLSFIFKAGPRYESRDSLGAAHTLRLSTALSTKNSTSFAIIRNMQQVGANLTCTADRETLSYTLTGTYNAVEVGSKYLSEIASCQAFKPWEVAEITPRLKLELACMTPEVKTMELLHAAAYRSGLGNSLFCPKHRAGKLSPECLQHYASKMLTVNRCAVVGLGVRPDELTQYAQNCVLMSSGPETTIASKYYGGVDARRERGGDLAYVALATESGGINDAIVFDVLKHALGTGPRVQWGNEAGSVLSREMSKASSGPAAMSAFSTSYSDSGLFGIMVVSGSEISGDLVRAAAEVLHSASITDKDVDRAKQQVKLDGLLRLEAGNSCIMQIAKLAVMGHCPQTPVDFAAAVEKITTDDVKKAAQKIASGKLTMAAVGNLSTIPYLDQLK